MPETIADKIYSLAKRRGFLLPSFEIYGGSAGFYDYGPLGTRLKQNIIELWRKYYVLGEGFFEIDTTLIAPEEVFKASGHVDKFFDILAECGSCGECYRADSLVASVSTVENVKSALNRNRVVCPACGQSIWNVSGFNLMFSTTIGKQKRGYLRPETAQAMFYNFALLYRYAREKLPFGVIQIGRSFRNEISPRQGVVRLREFNMAEAEIFVHPENKTWARFHELCHDTITFVPRNSAPSELTIEAAVRQKIVSSEAIGYFIGLTQRFLLDVGIDKKRLRFRQHLTDEMAHYASDCWDAEALLSSGWIELVGIADRGCFDLTQHISFSNVDLTAVEKLASPQVVNKKKLVVKFDKLESIFKSDAKKLGEILETLDPEFVEGKDSISLELNGKKFDIPAECYDIIQTKETITTRRFVPHVIEPSYGIDRIFYALLEHSFSERKDVEEKSYTVLRLPPKIAPITVGIFPLMAKDRLVELAKKIDMRLRAQGFYTYYDESGSIGRRYARMDEVGTPFCITVDYDSLKNNDATVRDRDTKKQIRVQLDELGSWLNRAFGITAK